MIIEKQGAGIKSNLLYCPIEKYDRLFFSLMDYLNNLFTSNDYKDILKFYDYFDDREQLIKWMRERPKGNYRIVEFNKENNDIIVVIPTMDVNGKFALNCKNEIFKGLHIIFVESGYNNYYFNYAHNCNAGIKKAMEYNPKWIIVSNDDMYKIDDIEVLKNKLLKINNNEIYCVFTKPSKYHSSPERIAERNILFYFYYLKNRYSRAILKLIKKFNIKYSMCPISGKFSMLFKKGYEYLEIQDFAIFSSNFIKITEGKIFDETFINGAEDTDLSLKLSLNPNKITIIDYKIGDYIGSTRGLGITTSLRSIAGETYLNYKWFDFLNDIL